MAAHHVTGGAGMVVGPLGLERHLRYWSRPRQGGEPQPPGGPGYLPSKTHLTIISPSHHHLTIISPSHHHHTIISPSHHITIISPSHHLHPTFSLSLSSSWRWHLPIFTHLIFLWFFRPYPTILILQILFPSQLTWKQGRGILYSHAVYIWIVLLFKYTKNSRRWENSLLKSGSGKNNFVFPKPFHFRSFSFSRAARMSSEDKGGWEASRRGE